ncbi:DUF434 domain-containing protein [Prosthecobacter debontii]|uniref:DUF434 domain-containing protein n=1 Tax=Prosthecobacter debontii TaxID=48467 RepID=UPI0015923284|nr:DUF434 domain-containing protein [Prosthecobacter debontii]
MADLSWLLSRGYARPSGLKLVGDRYSLIERQRVAVGRAACADANLVRRQHHHSPAKQIQGRRVCIDGFNLLVTLETLLGGGVLLLCRDGCVRDMSSVHGSYHAVAETDRAILMAAEYLQALEIRSAHWLLDSPVSNSGRLAQRLRDLAEERRWPWTVETVLSPDAVLKQTKEAIVITSDAIILDHAQAWYNLAAEIIVHSPTPFSWLMDLRS